MTVMTSGAAPYRVRKKVAELQQFVAVCACGCGDPVALCRDSDAACGLVRGQPRRFITGHYRHALIPLGERALAKIERSPTCWEWTGAKGDHGYGTITESRRGSKTLLAHRVIYELFVGPIPPGLTIDHLCRNRGCVNPDHLEAVSLRENVLRGTGVSVINAAKTHCANGHEFTPENTYHRPDTGTRCCRQCSRDRDRLRAPRTKRRAA